MMKAENARQIPITEVIEALGATFYRQERNGNLWYYSCLRNEKTPSMRVNIKTNKVKDFGDSRGMASTIDIVCDYHDWDRKCGVSDALKYLERFDILTRVIMFRETAKVYSEKYKIVSRKDVITDKAMLKEIARRGLSKNDFVDIFEQVQVMNTETGKKLYAFGMDNMKQGTECAAYFPKKDSVFEPPSKWKRCIGPKAPTIFKAHPESENVTAFVFSSAMDYVTYRKARGPQQKDEECIIYHGDQLVQQCAEYVMAQDRIKMVKHYKHTDEAGEKADNHLALLIEKPYGTMEHEYAGFKDLSEKYIAKATPGATNRPTTGPQPKYKP